MFENRVYKGGEKKYVDSVFCVQDTHIIINIMGIGCDCFFVLKNSKKEVKIMVKNEKYRVNNGVVSYDTDNEKNVIVSTGYCKPVELLMLGRVVDLHQIDRKLFDRILKLVSKVNFETEKMTAMSDKFKKFIIDAELLAMSIKANDKKNKLLNIAYKSVLKDKVILTDCFYYLAGLRKAKVHYCFENLGYTETKFSKELKKVVKQSLPQKKVKAKKEVIA
jgi:hypothetical protein